MAAFLITPGGKIRLRNGKLALIGTGTGTVTPPVDPDPPPVDPGPGTADGVITLNEPADYQGYQRNGTSKAVPISLSYTGGATQIEVRAVPEGTAITDTAYAWIPIPTNAAAKTASGTPTVQQGGMYVWQARDAANPATNVTGIRRFGVGMFLGLIGQSNMANAPSGAWYYPLGGKRSFFYNRAGVFNRVGRINDKRPENLNAGTYGNDYTEAAKDGSITWNGDFVVFLANQIAAALGIPVFLIERAVGGSAIGSWQAGQTNWNNFAASVGAAGGDIEAAIWYQGESNAAGMNQTTHRASLANVHAQCQALGGRSTNNFKFFVVALGPGSYGGSVEGEFGAMRALLCDYGMNTPGAFLAATAHDGQTSDGVHQIGSAYARIGGRSGVSVAAAYGVGVTAAGPRIASATINGAVITVNIAHTGGSALADGSGGTGQALSGFEVKESGVVATISSAKVKTANTIEVTLAAAPTGPVTLSYAMMNVPHATSSTAAPNLASVPTDNISYVRGLSGAPLQPCAAIAVN